MNETDATQNEIPKPQSVAALVTLPSNQFRALLAAIIAAGWAANGKSNVQKAREDANYIARDFG